MKRIALRSLPIALGLLALLPCAAIALDLKSVLDEVSKSNPDINAEEAAVGQSKARLDEARAGYYPTIKADGAIERRKLDVGGAGGSQTFTAKSVGVQAKQAIFKGFQTRSSVRLRGSELTSRQSELAGTRQATLLDAVTGYVNVLKDRNIFTHYQSLHGLVQGQLDGTRKRLSRGEATRTDEHQAEARVAFASAGLASAQEALRVSESDFAAVTGQMPETLAPLPVINNLPTSQEDAVLLAQRESPKIASAAALETAAKHNITFARGFLLPSVDAVGGIDYLSGGVSNLFTGALPNDRKAYYGGLQMEVPIFQGGAEYAGVRRAKEQLNQRRAERISAERDVTDQVKRAWAQLEGAQASIVASRQAVAASEKASDGVRREAVGGNRTLLDVLDAQRELLDAQVVLERSVANEYIARAALLGAIGRLAPQNFGTTP
jgi:outer membrane protein